MLTGLVVTSRVTHATPAAFSAHVVHRDMESEIAEQQIGDYVLKRQVDLLMGGGRCFFLPNTTEGGCRQDSRDLIKESANLGWKEVMLTRKDFDTLDAEDTGIPLPALGLFNHDHMNYEIDRDPKQEPSLVEMTIAALKALQGNAKPNQGFFLMIEGSRIDMAAHNNDPVAHAYDIIQYYETVKAVREFVSKNPDTLLISTSDHETGGFTLGLQPDPRTYPDYLWRPDVIKKAHDAKGHASTELLTKKLVEYQVQDTKRRQEFVKTEILQNGLGITDATDKEISFLADPQALPSDILTFLGHAISYRANLGWTTIGHTGVDVNLYADGDSDGYKDLRGNHENTDIGTAMIKYLNVDLNYITRKLAKDSEKWFKPKRGFWGTYAGRSAHQETGH
ncbi:hypothetical protein BGZ54_009330 [Gamsiella multidivaricata]|nr:hypothetical protein BGZ54_009330 [Gamsiella multidivaricata]